MALQQVRCPDCGKLLFKAEGNFDIEIMCNSVGCKTSAKVETGSRLKRLTFGVGKNVVITTPMHRHRFGYTQPGSAFEKEINKPNIGSFDNT